MISIKNQDHIAKMREAGALLYEVLQKLREAVKPGMTTAALDVYAEQLIRKNHATPSFLHYNGYPATLCTSVDDQVGAWDSFRKPGASGRLHHQH